MTLQWDPQLVTGNAPIDRQHIRIFEIFADLLAAVEEHRGHDEVGRILSTLSLFTMTHFRQEEALMAQSGYEGAAHREDHESLRIQMEGLVDQFHAHTLAPRTLLRFMEHWLDRHVQKHDKPLVRFLMASPVGDSSES